MIIIAEVSELTRKIKLPTDRVLSVNGDYQVDGIAFKLPATYEGDFDFSTAAARVHWTGVDKVEHTNLITEVDGNGYPLWVMPSELTQGGHGVIEFAISFVATDETAAITKRWISDPVSFRNRRTVNGSNEDEEAEGEAIYDRLASAIVAVRAAQASVDDVAEVLSSLGTLTFNFVDAKADMTDQTKLYVLTTDGYLYYYSTAASDFVPAFEVGGSQEVIDARTDENGTTYANLKTRINTGFTQLKEDLSGIIEDTALTKKISYINDGAALTNGYIDENGVLKSNTAWRATDYLNLETVNRIYVHVGAYTLYPLVVYFDATKQVISYESADRNYKTDYTNINLTIPSNAVYCRINMWLDVKDGSHDNQYIVITNKLQKVLAKKVDTVNGIAPDDNGNVETDEINDVAATYEMTDTEKIYRLDGEIYYYNGDKWIKVVKQGDENLIEKEEKNLVNLDNCTYGYTLKWQDGTIQEDKNYLVTEFLPVEEDVIYHSIKTVWICFYDSEKTYLGYTSMTLENVYSSQYDGVAYVRASALKSDKDILAIYKIKYLSPEDVSGEAYIAYSDKANDLFDKGMARLLESGSDLVVKGENLFDWKTDKYIGFSYNGNSNKLTFNKNFDSDGIPTSENTQIALPKYFRVNEGQTIFCNYALWAGRYYDANKNLLGTFPATNDAYIGLVAPEGCAYVRLNIKGTNANPTTKGRIGSLEEMKNLKVYVVDTEQSVAPKPPAVLRPYQIDGSFVAPNFLDYCIPTMNSSEFLSAMKCLTIREVNKRDHAWRFGNFNMWVMNGTRGWNTTRKMLMDYGVDFCGFEECNSTASIAEFMKGWQFPYGFTTNLTDGENAIDKGFVSRFEVISSTKLHFTTLSSNLSYLNCKVQLPRYMDVHNPFRVLSIYVVHFAITTQKNKVAIANELLEQIATDTSDFIVIAGDTNDFADTDETKDYWRTLEDGGFAPVLPMSSKTVTQDMLEEPEDYPEKNWKWHAIDQFFISSNIEAVSYGVVNTKDEYADEDCNKATSTDGEAALSDHDFVYADLRFNYDVVRSGLQ